MRFPVLLHLLLAGISVTASGFLLPVQAAEVEVHQYAVTLISSFDPIPESMVPRDIEGQVYRTQTTVFGRAIHFVRTGFYATAGEAAVVKERLTARFPAAHVTEVLPDEYLRVTGGRPRTAPTPRPPVVVATPPPPVVVPETAPVPATPPVAATPPETLVAPVLTGNVEQDAVTLMNQARAAITRGDNHAAIGLLEQVLRLPPNKQSQEAHELIGLAYEREKDLTAARREYTQYLQRYPEGPAAERVRQRLVTLEAPAELAPLKKAERRDSRGFTVNGSLSQFYYYGQSQVDSTTTVLGPATTGTFTGTDQSALISNLDLRARYRSETWDNRLVIRDTYTASFLDEVDSTNRLYSAYYELTNKVSDYSGRIGRQPGTSGGVLGRFDGIAMGYNVLPKWRVNLMVGKPVEFFDVNYAKQFWGVSLDYGLFANHWNGSFYYIQQTVDGIADRQAMGTELRYFDPKGSALLYLDYDTLYGKLNIATFQATWLSSPSTTWNTLLDRRRAPTLMTSNALFNTGTGTTLDSLLTTMTEAQLRQQALDNTPIFKTAMLGVAHNLNTTWQIGGDVKYYELTALPVSPTVTTTLGTGATLMYTAQTIANGLFRPRDLSVLSASYMDGETYSGQVLAFTQRMLFGDRWTVDLGLSYYQQAGEPVESTIDPGTGPETHIITTDTSRLVPMLRLGYRWRKNITLETELGYEMTTTSSVDRNITAVTTTATDTDATRSYFVLGYRWDF